MKSILTHSFKGILKLILVIFCISWKLAIGSINDIYETLTRFLSVHSTYANILKYIYKKVKKIVGIGWIG